METRLIGLYLVMHELGGFGLESFSQRLFLQKSIYLMQLLGIDFGFRFSWYIRGPYSRDLSSSAFEIEYGSNISQIASSYVLTEDMKKQIGGLQKIIKMMPEAVESKENWLELLSSIHYLKHIATPHKDMSKDNAHQILVEAGKEHFEKSQVEQAWECLNSVGLIDQKVTTA